LTGSAGFSLNASLSRAAACFPQPFCTETQKSDVKGRRPASFLTAGEGRRIPRRGTREAERSLFVRPSFSWMGLRQFDGFQPVLRKERHQFDE
jgi:hypothetical protein